jgi:hypothetical protein
MSKHLAQFPGYVERVEQMTPICGECEDDRRWEPWRTAVESLDEALLDPGVGKTSLEEGERGIALHKPPKQSPQDLPHALIPVM